MLYSCLRVYLSAISCNLGSVAIAEDTTKYASPWLTDVLSFLLDIKRLFRISKSSQFCGLGWSSFRLCGDSTVADSRIEISRLRESVSSVVVLVVTPR